MSLELVDECVKRLSQSLQQTEKVLSQYDSKELESLIYEMGRCESNYIDNFEAIKKVAEQYNITLQRFVEVNIKLAKEPQAPTPNLTKTESKELPKEG